MKKSTHKKPLLEKEKKYSDCCLASVIVKGNTTKYYICSDCKKACNAISIYSKPIDVKKAVKLCEKINKTSTLEDLDKEFDEKFVADDMLMHDKYAANDIKSFYKRHIIKMMESVVDKIDTFIQYCPENNGVFRVDEEEWDKFIKKIK